MGSFEKLKGLRVLIAEDNFLVAQYLSNFVETWGGKVIGPASDCESACLLAKATLPDIAFLDMALKGSNAKGIADVLDSSKVPFIVITGYERSWLPEGMLAAPYLSKPVSEDDLVATLDVVRPWKRRRCDQVC